MSFLELVEAEKSFGDTHVLSKVSLSVERGECVAIIGFSGSGKTTLISLLAGLELPDGGKVLFDGREVKGPGRERGLVFQNYSLLPWLSAFDNVMLAVDTAFPRLSLADRRAKVAHYLELVGLSHAGSRKPAELSGGMRQRVSVARALSADPEILLMDEPLSALDALTRASLQDEFERIGRIAGKTSVLVTNDVDEALLLADRIVPLSAGPKASLGPSIAVEIERPRDRKELNHDARFRALRAHIVDYLMSTRPARRSLSALPTLEARAAEVEVLA